jgi:hypothetical protein
MQQQLAFAGVVDESPRALKLRLLTPNDASGIGCRMLVLAVELGRIQCRRLNLFSPRTD